MTSVLHDPDGLPNIERRRVLRPEPPDEDVDDAPQIEPIDPARRMEAFVPPALLRASRHLDDDDHTPTVRSVWRAPQPSFVEANFTILTGLTAWIGLALLVTALLVPMTLMLQLVLVLLGVYLAAMGVASTLRWRSRR